ncbi:hypothetical protein BYT27DRAFT_7258088 [Phlegmacium glaucopus]|nr:hypothetical protein BYT27DRAFT_7258088 [Phlegmacium glaucopus]
MFAHAMDVDSGDAGKRTGLDSGSDWPMDGAPGQGAFDDSAPLCISVESPFTQRCQKYSPSYYYLPPPQDHYGTPVLSPSPMVSKQQTMPEFSPPSLSPLNLMLSLPQRHPSASEATHSQIEPPKIDSKSNHALKALHQLQAVKITASDLLAYIVKGEDGFEDYQSAFFSPSNRGSLLDLLNEISTHAKGSPIFEAWVGPRTLEIVCKKIHKEMEAAKPDLRMSTKDMMLEFIES